MQLGRVQHATWRATLAASITCAAIAALTSTPPAHADAAPPATSAAAQAPCVRYGGHRMCFAGGAWWRCSPLKNVKNKAAYKACEAQLQRKPAANAKHAKTGRPRT